MVAISGILINDPDDNVIHISLQTLTIDSNIVEENMEFLKDYFKIN